MENTKEKKFEDRLWVNKGISPIAKNSNKIEKFYKKLDELKEIAEEITPGGRLIVSLSSSQEKFRPIEKCLGHLVEYRKYFNENSIMKNPSIGQDLSELTESSQEINKIFIKRRKDAYKKRFNKKEG